MAAAFRAQARSCATLGSPFMARLCTAMAERVHAGALSADHGSVAARLLDWPHDPTAAGDAVPLRLAAAAHALVLADRSPGLAAVYPPHQDRNDDADLWAAVTGAMAAEPGHFHRWLDSAPQTNEVRRASALYLGLMAVARRTRLPIVLSEIGASAGLNLALGQFGYRFGGRTFGAPAVPLVLEPDWQGPVPAPAAVAVQDAVGCDLNPLNPSQADDRLRLRSYLWPDQAERVRLTQHAIAIARQSPHTVRVQDAVGFLRDRLADRRPGAAHAVMQSVVWQYLPADDRRTIADLMARHGARADATAPLAWIQMEPDGQTPGAGISLTLWPGGTPQHLGRVDYHGRWLHAAERAA